MADDGLLGERRPACRALVPFAEPTQWPQRPIRPPSPDATFVTHLIANAELPAQSRGFQRTSAAAALSAYRARRHGPSRTGLLTRQI